MFYFDITGIIGIIKFIAFQFIGLFKPIYGQVRQSDMHIVAHKSARLTAQNFMINMTAINYDTCQMEGFDSLRIKILHLPASSEINMLLGSGKGVYGKRFRVPFEYVYFEK
ncbi:MULTISPECIES: nitroreductase family protein [unclassified Flavobacterium]|uniref:nitroreductase family protein n=1 Tax=unclassified Flavobacterium TaxID=196869 RepID=UPI001F47CE21|nr:MULTISPECIES: nitroreductase family protein [unclassified Flavobacterium]